MKRRAIRFEWALAIHSGNWPEVIEALPTLAARASRMVHSSNRASLGSQDARLDPPVPRCGERLAAQGARRARTG
jgi:hypothetical protein